MNDRPRLHKRDRRPVALRVFVNYRRGDTAAYAGRLHDTLVQWLGAENVFMDVDAIDPGSDYRGAIDGAIAAADVVVALIGRGWLTATTDDGRRRLDDPDDVLRLELEAALSQDRVVIPVCVQDAAVPAADQLPASLRPLATRQGMELRDTSWRDDVERLLRRLERLAQPPAPPARGGAPAALRRLGLLRGSIALAAVLAAVVAAALVVTRDDDPRAGTGGTPASEEQLLAAIPLPLRTDCESVDYGPEAALVTLSCPGARASVLYHLFESPAVLERWYELLREELGFAPDTGTCTADEFAGEAAYRVGGEEVGRYVCYLDAEAPELIWTDERANAGVEANIWDRATEPDAPASMLRLWECCLQLEP
jgi:hypothetical protein